MQGHIDMVQFLLEHDADVRTTLNDGRSAIDIATQREHHDILDLLQKYI